MEIEKQELLRKTGISDRRLAWLRAIGLVYGPLRVVRLRGKGSKSYYAAGTVDRIRDIEQLRSQGRTVAEIRRIMTGAEEKIAAIYRAGFKRGDYVELSLLVEHGEVFRDIAGMASMAYSNELVAGYTVTSERRGKTRIWTIKEKLAKPEDLEAGGSQGR